MSTVGAFVIEELNRTDGEAERFEWTSDRAGENGGGRAIPRQPWDMGGDQRTVRTDYTGAKVPSEQVLGPAQAPQQFTGRWDDGYNFDGYAEQEMRRFEAMCNRGNLVRISFQAQSFEGLITTWRFSYRRAWDIHYTFGVSVHARADEYQISDRSPATTRSGIDAFDDVNDLVNALALANEEELRAGALEAKLAAGAADAAKAALATITAERSALGATLDAATLSPTAAQALAPFRRMATQYRTIANGAADGIQNLIQVRSDLELGVATALDVLNFESWSRSFRFQARVLMGDANAAAADMDERDAPDARHLYRPHRGESLYAIARKFYGAAEAWRLIADRNALTDFTLTGDELLIIPERGAG